MKRPPCIRGLKRFEKKGCPQRKWDGEDGCPAWIEDWVVEKGERIQKGMCVDMWIPLYLRFSLGLLEGNQQATESNRNMTALLSLSVCGAQSPSEIINVARKYADHQHEDKKQIA